MHIIQTLKNIFSKKTNPLKHVTGLTDSESQDRSAVLDLSSKTMSRIASITLFCFLSQTFAQTLYAATDGLKGLNIHLQAPVNLASLPTFSLSGTFSGADDTASNDSDYLATSGSSFSSTGRQARTPTDTSVPVSPTSPKAKEDVQKVLCQASLGGTFIRRIKGEHHHGWGVSTNITKEKNGFKLQVGHQNNLLLSAFIGFSGQMSVTHSALTDALSLSVKSYALVHFDKKQDAILSHVSVDAKDMQVTGDWHADSLTATTKRFSVKDKSALFVHEKAKITSDAMSTKGAKLNAKDLTVEAFEIDNENGTLGGMETATITLKKRASSRFQNKDGKIGSIKKAVFNIEDGKAIKHQGTLQGAEVVIDHKSSDDVLDLKQGVVQASKIVRLYGRTVKGRLSTDVGVQFETPLLWIDAKDFDLLPQTAVCMTRVFLSGEKKFHLTHDYRTAQKFSVTEKNFITKEKSTEALKANRVLSGKEFHIDAVVQAKSMKILTPSYTGVVGLEDGANSKRGELLTEEGHLDVISHDFDLQNGVIAADSADFIVRETLMVGRLVEDKTRNVFSTYYAHSQCPTSHHLQSIGGPVYCMLNGKRLDNVCNGWHLLKLPYFTDNQSLLKIRNRLHVKGNLENSTFIDTGSLSLMTKESKNTAGDIRIRDDFIIDGGVLKNCLLVGTVHWTYAQHGWQKHEQCLSKKSTLNVGGKIDSLNNGTIYNIGSILTAKKSHKAPKSSDFRCLYQKIIGDDTPGFRQKLWQGTNEGELAVYGSYGEFSIHTQKARNFLYHTNNFAGAQQVFPAQTSFGESVVLSDVTLLEGNISGSSIVIHPSASGAVIGSQFSLPKAPVVPTITMCKLQDIQAIVGANLKMNATIPTIHLSSAFRFYFQERFWHKEDEAQSFYDRVRPDIHIITKDKKFKPYQGQVIKMTPQLLLLWLQKKVQDNLRRGSINLGQAIDFDLVAELHKNGTEYLRKTGLDQESNNASALVLFGESPTTRHIPEPEEPIIFYLIDESDPHKSLMPTLYLPKSVRNSVHNGITANALYVIPQGFTQTDMQQLMLFHPAIAESISSTGLMQHLMIDAVTRTDDRVAAPANVEVHGRLNVRDEAYLLASGDLYSDATITSSRTMMGSTQAGVRLTTTTKRLGSCDNYHDAVDRQSSVHGTEGVAIVSPNGTTLLEGALVSSDGHSIIAAENIATTSVPLSAHSGSMRHRHYESHSSTSQHKSQIAGNKVTEYATGTLHTAGSDTQSGSGGTTLQGGQVIQEGCHNSSSSEVIDHHRKKTVRDVSQSAVFVPDRNSSNGGNVQVLSGVRPLHLTGTYFNVTENNHVLIETVPGAVLGLGVSQSVHQSQRSYKGFGKTEQAGESDEHITRQPVGLSGGGTMRINLLPYADGHTLPEGTPSIRIEIPERFDARNAYALVESNQNLSWVTDVLEAHEDVRIERVQDQHSHTQYRVTAMSPQLTMVIALAVSVCTSGGGLTAMSATQAMTAAATSALITQTITATVGYAMGDGKAFAKAVSEDKLKSVGIDVVCAGLTQGIANSVNTGTLSTLQAACLRTAVRELKVVALTGKWDAKGCLSREVATTIEGAAQSLVKSIGDKYSKDPITGLSQISGLEHKMLHGLTASIADAAAGLAESAITGQKVQGLLERSVAAGAGAVLVECVAEALYSPQDLLPLDEMSVLKKEAVQNAQTKLGESADPQKLAEETIRQFGALYHPHQNNHLENTRKIALLTNIAIGALANNPDVLQAMHKAAERALTHNFMEGAKKQAAQVWEEVEQIFCKSEEQKEAEAFLESIQRDEKDHDPEFWEHNSTVRQILRGSGKLAEYAAYTGAGLRGGRAGFVVGGVVGTVVPGVGNATGAAVGSVAGTAGAIYVTQEMFERLGGILGGPVQDAHAWLHKEYGAKTAETFMMNLEAVGALSAFKIVQVAKTSVAQAGKNWHHEARINANEATASAPPAARSTIRPQAAGQAEVNTLQQMSGKVNRHGTEAKALRETREARSAGLEKLAQRQETELFLKHNKGSRQAFERKVDALDDLAKRGKLAKTQSVRDPSLTDKYRDTLLKRAEREWKQSDPEKFQRMKEKFLKMDADHLQELQLGGTDHFSALTMLDKPVNRSVGAQLGHQLRTLPDGTKVTRVLEKGVQ